MNSNPVTRKRRKTIGIALCLGVASWAIGTAALAERIVIPLGQQGQAWNVETPPTGTHKDSVEQRFGSPLNKSGPVGDPPIYTWEYEKFRVYFESDYVIHSVVKHQPENP